jgi:ABC-type Na+ efflux pump permease subunit
MRLIRSEVLRLVGRPRLWLTLSAATLYSALAIYQHRDGAGGQEPWWYVFQLAVQPLQVMLPLVIVAIAGTSVAEDRSRGFVRLLLARSISPVRYVAGKLAAAAAVTLLFLGAGLIGLGAFARAVAPSVGTAFPAGSPAGFPRTSSGLIVAVAAITCLAAVFYLGVASAVALLSANVFAVAGVPILLHLVPSVLLPINGWKPLANLQVQAQGPSFVAIIIYWSLGIVGAVVASHAIASWREAL